MSNSTDPMSDRTIERASTVIDGSRYRFEVEISCADGALLRWEAASFMRSNDSPASLRLNPGSTADWTQFWVRADSGEPTYFGPFTPEFENQVNWGEPLDALARRLLLNGTFDDMARSSRLMVRVLMPDVNETITIDQSAPGVRSLLDTCLAGRAAYREDGRRESEERERERERQNAPPPSSTNATGSAEPDSETPNHTSTAPNPMSGQSIRQRHTEAEADGERHNRELEAQRRRERVEQEERRVLVEQREEQRQRQQQAQTCEQIRAAGTTNADYLRAQGCR